MYQDSEVSRGVKGFEKMPLTAKPPDGAGKIGSVKGVKGISLTFLYSDTPSITPSTGRNPARARDRSVNALDALDTGENPGAVLRL
jgi:hypothetical protein